MSDQEQAVTPPPPSYPPDAGPGYEVRDVQTKPLLMLGVGLLVLTALASVVSWGGFKYLERRAESADRRVSALEARHTLPPEPRLQTTPQADLRGIRAAEEARLKSYGWVDRGTGVAHIPIERAIEILTEKGLPVRPQDEGAR